MLQFFDHLWAAIEKRLAEAIIAAVMFSLASVAGLWVWRFYLVDPALSELRVKCSSHEERSQCDRIRIQLDDLRQRVSRIEGKLGVMRHD